jgi:hypothetical protein
VRTPKASRNRIRYVEHFAPSAFGVRGVFAPLLTGTCNVLVSRGGRVGGAGGCPAVRGGIISPACVQHSAAGSDSSPDDHLAAGPYRRVPGSGSALMVLVAAQLSVLGLYLAPVCE